MANDLKHGPEPGEEGTMVGDIKTPMCSANVGKKGDGSSVHKYKGMPSSETDGGLIEGPGAKGTGGEVTIAGSNISGKY